jgi:hypothetical protein
MTPGDNGNNVYPDAVCFQPQMPGELARIIHSPPDEAGFFFCDRVEDQEACKRFTLRHCHQSRRPVLDT